MSEQGMIKNLFQEKTPIRQFEYFEFKIHELKGLYKDNTNIISCGYGKKNVAGLKTTNELTALARGAYYFYPEESFILDIGGQDTKIIRQEKGNLKEFFLNDKCAAGSGLFLCNVVNMFGKSLEDMALVPYNQMTIKLSSTCSVFAQSEIVEFIADNVDKDMIFSAVVFQILTQAKKLLSKVNCERLVLSGGLTKILDIKEYAENIFNVECVMGEQNAYLAAVGCAKL
jgi:predicted CoA-substrate-specific enzyme activase